MDAFDIVASTVALLCVAAGCGAAYKRLEMTATIALSIALMAGIAVVQDTSHGHHHQAKPPPVPAQTSSKEKK